MPTHAETIDDIREEIEKRHVCRAVHVRTNLVNTVLTDELLLHLHKPFQTNVETFQLIGHSSATIAYGWQLAPRTRSETLRNVVYLHTLSISSPKSALDEWAKGDWFKFAAQ